MRKLLEENQLHGIIGLVKPVNETNDVEYIFVDNTGHGGPMLRELAALAWLSWFYTGEPLDEFDENVIDWNIQNVKDILNSVENGNEDYRLLRNDVEALIDA